MIKTTLTQAEINEFRDPNVYKILKLNDANIKYDHFGNFGASILLDEFEKCFPNATIQTSNFEILISNIKNNYTDLLDKIIDSNLINRGRNITYVIESMHSKRFKFSQKYDVTPDNYFFNIPKKYEDIIMGDLNIRYSKLEVQDIINFSKSYINKLIQSYTFKYLLINGKLDDFNIRLKGNREIVKEAYFLLSEDQIQYLKDNYYALYVMVIATRDVYRNELTLPIEEYKKYKVVNINKLNTIKKLSGYVLTDEDKNIIDFISNPAFTKRESNNNFFSIINNDRYWNNENLINYLFSEFIDSKFFFSTNITNAIIGFNLLTEEREMEFYTKLEEHLINNKKQTKATIEAYCKRFKNFQKFLLKSKNLKSKKIAVTISI